MSDDLETEPSDLAAAEEAGENMHVHKPKAAHGVREFLSEIGVIVVGILIALAGEQVVETLHWQARVREAEANMRTELLEDDGPQVYHRLAQSPCIAAQLDALERGLIEERDHGTPFHPAQLVKPYYFTWDAEAWQSAQASGVTGHMSDKQMVDWSNAYAIMPALNNFAAREDADYAELASVASAPPHPSDDLRNRLIATIYRARADNASLRHNGIIWLHYLRDAGLSMTEAQKRSVLKASLLTFSTCSALVEPERPR